MEGSVELLLCAVRCDGGEEGGVDWRACASHTTRAQERRVWCSVSERRECPRNLKSAQTRGG